MKLPLSTFLLVACGAVHFTEPNPPQLFRSVAQYTSDAVPEPVVWLPVLDLFTESGNAAACAAAHDWTLQAIHDAMTAIQAPQMELQHADLSPSCAQAADRSLDTNSLEQEIRSAVAAFPSAHVRVVVVYANDIALEVPGAIVDGLQTLRQGGLLWTMTRDPVSTQLASDRTIGWTFVSDPALRTAIGSAAALDLPLQTDSIDDGEKPILGRDDLPRAREIKICAASQAVVQNAAANGTPSPVDTRRPPTFRPQFTQHTAVPKSQFSLQHAKIDVEGCSAHCDRYFSARPGDLRRWETTAGCLL
ncbi:MAG: hypothetical protein ABR567_10295 [Myxococcales bacterium]